MTRLMILFAFVASIAVLLDVRLFLLVITSGVLPRI